MHVWICGARGSTPAVGADFNHVGGHTSCIAIGQDERLPTLVLDAGTGLRNLTGVLAGAPFRGTILLSHLHWDHTHGLPFFAAGDRPDASTRLFLPEQGVEPMELLARTMSPPHFPIGPHQLRGDWSFGVIDRGAYRFEGFDVLVREIPHKGGKTLGFRVSDGAHSLAYLSDHAPQDRGAGRNGVGALHEDALDLARCRRPRARRAVHGRRVAGARIVRARGLRVFARTRGGRGCATRLVVPPRPVAHGSSGRRDPAVGAGSGRRHGPGCRSRP